MASDQSANNAGDDLGSPQPPVPSNPLRPLWGLVILAILMIVVIAGVWFAVIPLISGASKFQQRIRPGPYVTYRADQSPP